MENAKSLLDLILQIIKQPVTFGYILGLILLGVIGFIIMTNKIEKYKVTISIDKQKEEKKIERIIEFMKTAFERLGNAEIKLDSINPDRETTWASYRLIYNEIITLKKIVLLASPFMDGKTSQEMLFSIGSFLSYWNDHEDIDSMHAVNYETFLHQFMHVRFILETRSRLALGIVGRRKANREYWFSVNKAFKKRVINYCTSNNLTHWERFGHFIYL
jgi:hypothetical protein